VALIAKTSVLTSAALMVNASLDLASALPAFKVPIARKKAAAMVMGHVQVQVPRIRADVMMAGLVQSAMLSFYVQT